MPIQNFHEDFLGHKIEACDVEKGGLYIMRFNVDCHKREFVPYSQVIGGGVDVREEGTLIQTGATCLNFMEGFDLIQSGGCINVSYTPPTCYSVPITMEEGEGGYYLVLNSGTACQTQLFLGNLGGGGVSKSYELLINVDDPEVNGKQYQSFDNANTFLDTQTLSEVNQWNIGVAGVISENIVKKDYVGIYGEGRTNTFLTGLMTLENGTDFGPYNLMLNGLYHLSLVNLLMRDVLQSSVQTEYEIIESQQYFPHKIEFNFSVESTSGTYNIQVNGVSSAPLAFNATASDIQNAIIALDPVKYASVGVSGTYTTGFQILEHGAPANAGYGPITLGNIDLDPFIAIGFTPYVGVPQQQKINFSCPPTSGDWMLSYVYNNRTYYSYLLSYNSDALYVKLGLLDIFARILSVEGIDLGTMELEVTGDYNIGFTISFDGFPGVSNNLFDMVTHIGGSYSGFTGTVELAGGGTSTHFTVNADNVGYNPIQITGFTGNPGDTISSRISLWNASNPTNTVTLLVGDGSQVPAFKQYIQLNGGETPYNYNLMCENSLGQMMYLEDCDVGQIDYLGTKGMLIARNCTLYGGSVSGCDGVCNLHTCIINGLELPNSVATYDTQIVGSQNMYGGDFYGGVIDLDQCTLNTAGLDGGPVVYRFYGTTIKGVYNGDAMFELYNTIGGTFNMTGGYILTFGCAQIVVNMAGGGFRQNYSDIYDNRISGLGSTEYQAVIDEIVMRMTPQSGSGSPVGVATPRYVGDRYVDVNGSPTIYTAYGLLDTQRIVG